MTFIRRVACAVSGGVDSAVAALLLKRKGFDVQGVFMRNWDVANEAGYCSADRDLEDAKYVCHRIGIPLHEVNFVKQYWNEVFSPMLQEYQSGMTPNPDVMCNRHVKFGAFFNYAINTLGVDAVATGHYARNSAGDFLEQFDPHKGSKMLLPVDSWKDQTLFLCQIGQKALQRTMFPVGALTKDVVKQMAMQVGLQKIVDKKESMGICFIGKRNFSNFIEQYIEPKPGNFINIETGEEVGQHKGTHYWTVGQRTLISGQHTAFFVAEINHDTHDIMVAQGTNHPALFTDSMLVETPSWIEQPPAELRDHTVTYSCQFRFQHSHPLIRCTVQQHRAGSSLYDIYLDQPLRAITAGQYAVLYRDNECLGGAKIIRPGHSLYAQDYREPVANQKQFT